MRGCVGIDLVLGLVHEAVYLFDELLGVLAVHEGEDAAPVVSEVVGDLGVVVL